MDCNSALQPLLRGFSSNRVRRRAVLWLRDADLDVEARDAVRVRLIRALSIELTAPHSRAALRAFARFGLAVLACVLVGSLIATGHSGSFTSAQLRRTLWEIPGISGGVLLVAFPIWPAALWASYRLDGRRRVRARSLVQALGVLHDPRSAGALARAFRVVGLRDSAGEALRRTLPLIGAAEVGCYAWQEQEAMARAVRRADPELAAMLLNALAEVGSADALMVLRQLADSARACLDPAVLTQLKAAAAAIEVRLLEGAQQQSLLRSSDSAAPDRETLARVLGAARVEPGIDAKVSR
ncbi:MAG: hypothetical protein KGJ62_00265 [Armatimonadetes bacterium]|nr:hypothetical protein [Armatimonadota bacterium]MDE2206057.1 hypothetical protein [Armatimonadota bacterium]